MLGKEIDEKKTKYFVIAIIILIVLSILLVIHFNNKSLVNGDENVVPKITTTTTTTKTTTKVKKDKIKVNNVVNIPSEEIKEEVLENVEEEVYKTTIDEDNKLIYDYKLSEEITSTDVIKSEDLNLDEVLKSKNIIKLYDISLYDADNIKKSVKNTSITISIPVTKDIEEYENYKIVYIDENNEITEEEFESVVENGYIKFTTTHLSKFGIVGTKKIDLTNVTLDIKINDEAVNVLNDVYVSTEDKIDVIVNDLDSDYAMSYLLMDENSKNEYKLFNKDMFSLVSTPSKYTLIIKIEVENNEKVFEIGKFNIYDIVFNYDVNEEVEEDVIVGEIESEDGTEYNYVDKEINKDIVIINKQEEKEETEETLDSEDTIEEDKNDTEKDEPKEESELVEVDTKITEESTLEDNNDTLNSETETDTDLETNEDDNNIENNIDEKEKEPEEEIKEDLEDKATIKVNGNIYLVEKTDISNLEMTGYLIIDTDEDINFATSDEGKLLTSNLYTITIKSKEFSLNGVKYTYEYVNDKLVITKLENNTEVRDFEDLFDGLKLNSTEKEIVLESYLK